MKIKVHLYKAFTNSINGGNPCGVVYEAENLTSQDMQNIAEKVNVSETVFIKKLGDRKYNVRFFTPKVETNLCGHGTLSAFKFINSHTGLEGDFVMDTRAGELNVMVRDDSIFMEQSKPISSAFSLDDENLFRALNIGVDSKIETLSIEIFSTATPKVMIPVKSREELFNIKPNFDKLIEISKSTDSKGFYAFTFDSMDSKNLIHARQFNPLFGVPEDPVTGVAGGALGAYLKKHYNSKLESFSIEQGNILNMPGIINVKLHGDMVYIGGNAVLYDNMELHL